jgi:hypothetical protein
MRSTMDIFGGSVPLRRTGKQAVKATPAPRSVLDAVPPAMVLDVFPYEGAGKSNVFS